MESEFETPVEMLFLLLLLIKSHNHGQICDQLCFISLMYKIWVIVSVDTSWLLEILVYRSSAAVIGTLHNKPRDPNSIPSHNNNKLVANEI